MPPHEETEIYVSSLGIKYPANRDNPLRNGLMWLDDKRADDGAEGLWRIHDDLYDFTDFVKLHPGGSDWLRLTKGTDISEAFESHHISTTPEKMLSKYYIRKALSPRNSPFTFEDDGFFRTLKRNVREKLETVPKENITTTKMFTDFIVAALFVFAILATFFWSYICGIIAGFFLSFTTIAAHNYLHMKDNFRMHYFCLSMMQLREWRISHALSHHLYPNTVIDMELSIVEPLVSYRPMKKSFLVKYASWIYVFPLWTVLFHSIFVNRIYLFFRLRNADHMTKSDLIPFTIPLAMYFFGGQSLLWTIWMWTLLVGFGSLWFSIIAFTAGHHHPSVFHDGDTPRAKKIDWGMSQLDAVMDRYEIKGCHFLVLTNFGDHGLHHLFPTIDHGILVQLYPVLEETMKKFNVELRMRSPLALAKGQFLQLSKETPNPYPPGTRK